MELRETQKIRFPEYCEMDDIHKIHLTIAAASGYRIDRNACCGCQIYTCFSNAGYGQELTKDQKQKVESWTSYISRQVSSLEQPDSRISRIVRRFVHMGM